MIYIDPPYNTGNDFIYNDKFSMTKEESDIQDGTISELGERYTVNKDTSNRYHANWLNMMYPRLKVAKDLLTDDGVIFISIDDNEQDNLKKVCDEIFGEDNFVSQIIWRKKTGASDAKGIATISEYILVYIKSYDNISNIFTQNKESYDSNRYKLKDEYIERRGAHYIDNLDRGGIKYSDSMNYPIECPDGTITYPNGRTEFINDGWIWTWGKEKLEWGLKNGFIVFRKSNVKSSGWGVYYKNYMFVNNKDELTERSAPHKNMITDVINTNASKDIKDMFGAKVFQYTKPKDLIKRLISFVNLKEDDIILDFFSGSSSTAHATMQLNAEDGGNRKFIMVQLPEETSEKSEAYKAGYKNICEIGKERIRRAGEKIKEENKDKEGIEDLDVGFKVFRVADTNIRWNYETVNSSTLDMFKNIENSFGEEVAAKAITPLEEEYYRNKDGVDFMPNSKDIDIVYEILLRQRDIHLSEKVELLSDIGERTYLFADSYLVCLEKTITKELIEKIASLDPLPIKFVFRDSAFEDNISLKDEAIRRLKALIDKNSEGNKVVYTVEFI